MESGSSKTGSPASNMVSMQHLSYTQSYEPMATTANEVTATKGKAMLEVPKVEGHLHPHALLSSPGLDPPGVPPAPAPSPNDEFMGPLRGPPFMHGIEREEPLHIDQQIDDNGPSDHYPARGMPGRMYRSGAMLWTDSPPRRQLQQVDKSMLAYSNRVRTLTQNRALSLRSPTKLDCDPQTASPQGGRRWVTLRKVRATPIDTRNQENIGVILGCKPGVTQARTNSNATADNFRPTSDMAISANSRQGIPSPVHSPLRPVSDPLSSINTHVNMLHNPYQAAAKRYGSDHNLLERTKLHGETNVLTLNSSPEGTSESLPVGQNPTESIKIVPFPAIEVQAVPVVIHDGRRTQTQGKSPNLKQPLAAKNAKRPYFLTKSVLPPIPKVSREKLTKSRTGSAKSDEGSLKQADTRKVVQGKSTKTLPERRPAPNPKKRDAPLLSGSRALLHDKPANAIGVPRDKSEAEASGNPGIDRSIQVEFPEDPDLHDSIVIPSAGAYSSDDDDSPCGSSMSAYSTNSAVKADGNNKEVAQCVNKPGATPVTNTATTTTSTTSVQKEQTTKKPSKSFTPRKVKSPPPGANRTAKSLHSLQVRFGGMKRSAAGSVGASGGGEEEEEGSNSVDSQAALKPSIIKSVLKKRGDANKAKNVKFGAELEFIRMVTKIEYPWYNEPSSGESDSGEDEGEDGSEEDEEEQGEGEREGESNSESSDEDSDDDDH